MLLVFTPKLTSRIRYIFNHIFYRMLNLKVEFTNSIEDFVAYNGPKLSYSNKPLGKELFFFSHPFLIDQGIHNISVDVLIKKKYPIIFPVNHKSAMELDIFAASFYLISRYEEYLPHLKDSKGRFQLLESIAFKNNFLDKPLVDIWVNDLKLIINRRYKNLIKELSMPKKIIPILEVSDPYLFRQKSFVSTLLQSFNLIWNLKFKTLLYQFYVLIRIFKDPYTEYDFLIKTFNKHKINLISFFRFTQHASDLGAISIFNYSYRLLIKNISDQIQLSLLVSFFGQKNQKVLKSEMINLTRLTNRSTKKVRLNYGILSLSEVYPNLVQNEVKEDYSMGYADHIGYRASTCVPFYFYDLMNEVQTPLKIYPVIITENGLRKFSSKKAFFEMKKHYQMSPLTSSVFSFAFSPRILSKSPDNLLWRSSFLEYISEYET